MPWRKEGFHFSYSAYSAIPLHSKSPARHNLDANSFYVCHCITNLYTALYFLYRGTSNSTVYTCGTARKGFRKSLLPAGYNSISSIFFSCFIINIVYITCSKGKTRISQFVSQHWMFVDRVRCTGLQMVIYIYIIIYEYDYQPYNPIQFQFQTNYLYPGGEQFYVCRNQTCRTVDPNAVQCLWCDPGLFLTHFRCNEENVSQTILLIKLLKAIETTNMRPCNCKGQC